MFNIWRKNDKIIYFLLLIYILIITIGFLSIFLNGDEQFTMGLIHNSYSDIIKFDSLDVHPPLYYFLLKLFLQIFTFWTNSILIKIIFARLFSLISLIIFILFGFKILKLTNLRLKKTLFILIFLAVPSILLFSQYIRMYIFAGMFLIIELYELIMYLKYDDNNNLIISVIMGSLAAYTHYFAAISAGLYLFYFFLIFLYKKDKKNYIKIMLSGIIYLLLYLPWLFIARKQFNMATSGQYSTNQIYTKSTYTIMNFVDLCKQSLLSLVGGQIIYGNKIIKIIYILLIILFIYFIYWSICNLCPKFNFLLIISGLNLLGTILVALLISIIKHPILIDHYLFPPFIIFSLFMSYVIYQYLLQRDTHNIIHLFISLIIVLLLITNIALYSGYNMKNLIKSHTIITEINTWSKFDHEDIYIKNSKKNIWNIANDSIYLRPMNRVVKTNNFANTNQMFGKSDIKLMHGVYPNIKK